MSRFARHDEADRLLKALVEEERERLVRALAKLLIEDEEEQRALDHKRSYR